MTMKTQKLIISLLFLIPCFLFGETLTVKQDGTGNYTTIQEAINNATIGDTVLVYPGNYIEIIDFIGKDIVVASLFLTTQDTSYISQTIIDGNNENYKLVRFTNGETENAVLMGFTITNAYFPVNNSKPNRWTSIGLGIYINGSSPVIDNNHIVNNSYNSGYYCPGGGVVIENSSAKIINNIISQNKYAYHGGGIYINISNNVIIENNSIDNNTVFSGYGVSFGAGIYIDSSQYVKINNNSICGNRNNNCGYGGGVYISESDNITILNNDISNNKPYCDEGGGIYTIYSSNISVIGNLLYNNNVSGRGAGIYCSDTEINITNNTICFNTANSYDMYGKGGGIYCINSSPTITNTIIFSNTAINLGDQIYLDKNSDPNFFYSDIEGGVLNFGLNDTVTYTGIYDYNIDIDPQFLLSGDYPYSLSNNSPCINAGNPDTTGLNIPYYDLAGNIRIANGTIDIGAHEHLIAGNLSNLSTSSDISIYPNPAKDILIINFDNNDLYMGIIQIFNTNGQKVYGERMTKKTTQIDVRNLQKGIYFIKFNNQNKVETRVFIKQ